VRLLALSLVVERKPARLGEPAAAGLLDGVPVPHESGRDHKLGRSLESTGTPSLCPLGRPGDLGWVVERHGTLYAAEHGWDASFEGLVARILADFAAGYDPAREAGWIAELDGRRAGSVFCIAGDEPGVAKLRALIVDPPARGRGIGTLLVERCIAFARKAGYERLELWTTSDLEAAGRLYDAAGFRLVREEIEQRFGTRITSQFMALEL
jgi:GNAT superfamily N-acetyltransferase